MMETPDIDGFRLPCSHSRFQVPYSCLSTSGAVLPDTGICDKFVPCKIPSGGVAQWESTCFACRGSGVQIPPSPPNTNKTGPSKVPFLFVFVTAKPRQCLVGVFCRGEDGHLSQTEAT